MSRVSLSAGGLTVLVVFLSGCERGCLSTWWQSHTGSGASQHLTSGPEEKPGCVSGLVRCSGGDVQASRADPAAHCSPEGCKCPWDTVGHCARGCVEEGVPLEMPTDAGVVQLCAPEPNAMVIARVEDVGIDVDAGAVQCEMEGFSCMNGRVSSCESSRVVVCAHGCAALDDLRIDGEDLDAAALILCARP